MENICRLRALPDPNINPSLTTSALADQRKVVLVMIEIAGLVWAEIGGFDRESAALWQCSFVWTQKFYVYLNLI